MSAELLAVVALAEAALAAVVAGFVVGHAALAAHRDRSRTERLRAARAVVTRSLDGPDADSDAVAVVEALPAGGQIRLFCDLARTLDGARRRALAELAARSGLIARAERWCRRRRWWWRLRGARLLTALGAGGRQVLELFEDRRPEVRAQAAEWASGHPEPEAVTRLLGMLEDDRTLCRFTVKDSLLRLGPVASAHVAGYLAHPRDGSVVEALEVAAGIADARFLEPALLQAQSDAPATRARAAALLGAIGGERATERLAELVGDDDPAVRAAAATALGRLGHWPASAALYERLGDRAWDVRRAAALSLRRLGPAGMLMLRRATEHPDAFGRDMARQVLDLPDTES